MADANDSAAILAQVNENLKNLGYISQETTERMNASEKAAKDFEAKMALGGKAVSALADAGMAAASAMYEGKKGAAAFNQSIDHMAEAAMAAGAALTLMIPGGPVIKALVAGMTLAVGAVAKYTKAANEMSDKLYTSFQKMSKSGAAASDGMTGIYKGMQKLGLGIQDLDSYVELLNANAKDLALFGGSVFEGRKRFEDMGAAMEPFREQLYNAGLSQEEINAGSMAYLKLQTRIGQAQTQTTKQLADGAKKYLIEQDALTKLTGQSRSEAEQAMEAARSEQRFRAKLESMRNSGDAKQIAAADELEKANRLISSQSKEAGQSFRDLSTGMVTTEAAQKGLISSNGVLMDQAQKIAAGQQNAIDGTKEIGGAFGQFAKDTNMLAQAGVFEDIGIKFSEAVELGLFANRDLAAEYGKIQKDQEAQGVTGKKAADELQQAQTDLRLEQLKAMQAAQDFVAKGMLPATYASIKMAGATETAVSALNRFATSMNKILDKLLGFFFDDPEVQQSKRTQLELQDELNTSQATFLESMQQAPAKLIEAGGDIAAAVVGFANEGAGQGIQNMTNAAKAERVASDSAYLKSQGRYKAAPAAPGGPAGPTSTPAGAPTARGMSAQDLARSGLQIRAQGDVQAPGEEVSPALIELAKKIQKSVPDFSYFSGFNDQFHNEKSPRSLHTQGLAADFVVGKKPSKEEGQQIVSLLKTMGASKAIDEYNAPSAKATGGHFHFEIPKFGDGGISPGPQMALVGEKGPEAHVPLKDGAIPVSIDFGAIFEKQEAARKQNISISLADATFGSGFGTGNDFTGPQMGPLTTDMAALKDIAAKLGAYDAQNEIITNPNTWKDIIKSGMLQNYDVGVANIGSRMIGDDAGNILGDRVKEVMEMNKVDVNAALAQTAKEFKDAMLQIITQMQQQKDPELQVQMIEHLAAISRSGASTATASERMAAVASN